MPTWGYSAIYGAIKFATAGVTGTTTHVMTNFNFGYQMHSSTPGETNVLYSGGEASNIIGT